jgi:NAD(P) transhydrogenase
VSGDGVQAYDLIVIGGGPAGIVGATTAASFGKSVALIDNHHELGGAGANTGTVPSKTLRETALALSGMRSRNLYGVDLSLRRQATVADLMYHEHAVKTALNESLAARMRDTGTAVIEGTAEFESPNLVRVRGTLLRGEKIMVATGSSPVRPPNFPFGSAGVYDSDTILELDCVPNSMAVVGAGTIGCEYACTFAALGTKMHLIDGRDVLLSFLDSEISKTLAGAMIRNGIEFHWKEEVTDCNRAGDSIGVRMKSGKTLTVEAVLVAAGRKSNVGQLNLAAAGLVTGDHGVLPVDDLYRTRVPHIYAVGDVIGFPALASTGTQQARRAMRCAFGADGAGHAPEILPSAIYTIPEVSMAGQTEEALRKAGVDYVVGRALYAANARGRIIGDVDGFLKLIFRRDNLKLLGVHTLGEQASDLVHIGLIALLTGSNAGIFDDACFNIPTLGALYKAAAREATIAATVKSGA